MDSYILLFVGCLLILLEFFLPGAILGVSGGILILFGGYLIGMEGSFWQMLLYVCIAVIAIVVVVKFALWYIRYASKDQGMFLKSDQSGYKASSFDESAIGKRGIAQTELKPGGYIIVEDKKHQAISQSGYIPRGGEVEVLSGQEESLIVKQVKKEKHT